MLFNQNQNPEANQCPRMTPSSVPRYGTAVDAEWVSQHARLLTEEIDSHRFVFVIGAHHSGLLMTYSFYSKVITLKL